MTTRELVDPELLPLIDAFPPVALSAELLAPMREALNVRFDMLAEPELALEWHAAAGRDGAKPVDLLLVRPTANGKLRPAILFLHGGGMVVGSAHGFRHNAAALAQEHGAVVVSVDYRLAPETPFPGPQEDCYAALAWLADNATSLDVDPSRIAVMGESAGAGLAAALAVMARDRGEYRLCGQILVTPMLDCRTGGPESLYDNPTTGEFIWTRESNAFGWTALRGEYRADDHRAGWFSPALAADLTGVAPAMIVIGSLDLFLDESLAYTARLSAARVPTELHVYPGAVHGFTLIAASRVARRASRDVAAAIDAMFAEDNEHIQTEAIEMAKR